MKQYQHQILKPPPRTGTVLSNFPVEICGQLISSDFTGSTESLAGHMDQKHGMKLPIWTDQRSVQACFQPGKAVVVSTNLFSLGFHEGGVFLEGLKSLE